jgi:23S rRNA pseudouridine2605 synthase
MSNFKKPSRSFSDRKKPDGKKSTGRAFKKSDSDSEKGDGYKAKRSFTKNKELRKSPGFKSRSKYGTDRFKKDDGGEKRSYTKSRDFDKGDREKRDFKRDDKFGDKKPFREKRSDDGEKRFSRGEKSERFDKGRDGGDRKPFREKRDDGDKKFSRGEKTERFSKDRESGERKPFREKSDRFTKSGGDRKPFREKRDNAEKKYSREGKSEEFNPERSRDKKSYRDDDKKGSKRDTFIEKRVKYDDFEEGRSFSKPRRETKERKPAPKSKPNPDGLTRLNKYLANAGIASRREADTLIQSGVVKVNGVPVTEMGFKVKPGDTVTYGDAAVKGEKKVYLLLNKPKDYITTVDDPQERKTVMHLIEDACKERVYPVGRLDRNTTGLLLFTNDGELTKKLTHPKHEIKKVYHVSLNKGLKPDDFKAIIDGVELEDGTIKADDLAFVGEGKKEVGIEIHSGKNRVVRRLFEQLGYEVLKLDRVVFAGLTKKDLPRGKYRFLTSREVNFLQMIG